jgi:hypothetical protein
MERAEAIRTLFIEHHDDYALDEAARLVGWSSRQMAEEIASSELRQIDDDARVSWQAVAAIATTIWSQEQIEAALGVHAHTLPPLTRLTERTVRLPGYQLLALEAAALRRGQTLNELLATHVLDLTCAEAPALVDQLPGFREAFFWPQSVRRQSEHAA